jgi:hypothetical protein
MVSSLIRIGCGATCSSAATVCSSPDTVIVIVSRASTRLVHTSNVTTDASACTLAGTTTTPGSLETTSRVPMLEALSTATSTSTKLPPTTASCSSVTLLGSAGNGMTTRSALWSSSAPSVVNVTVVGAVTACVRK